MALTFLNPAALAALAAVAVPIVVHLLLRQRARRQTFPSLRFIRPANAAAVRLRAITDWPLLAVRCAIVAAAALAIARPLVVTPARRAGWDARVARAVVVDVSASSRRAARPPEATDEARAAFRSTVIEAARLDRGVAEAVRWLDLAPPARRELVIISDFQRGSIDDTVLVRVPSAIGVRFRSLTPDGAAPAAPEVAIDVRAPAADQALVNAALKATDVKRGQSRFYESGKKVTVPFSVVFATKGAEPMTLGPFRAPWMAVAAEALGGHSAGSLDERTLGVVLDVPASSFELPLAIRAVRLALLAPAAWQEVEDNRIPEATLTAWSRPPHPSDVLNADRAEEDDARWVWLVVLALLALETWLRRRLDAGRRTASRAPETTRAA